MAHSYTFDEQWNIRQLAAPPTTKAERLGTQCGNTGNNRQAKRVPTPTYARPETLCMNAGERTAPSNCQEVITQMGANKPRSKG